MTRQLLLGCVAVGLVAAAGNAAAHHTTAGATHTMATVRIAQPVLADGKPLAPGTYEVIITDEHPPLDGGTPSENQRLVEFVQDKRIIATEIAEVFPVNEQGVVGTSGSDTARAVVQRLRGDEFVRIAVSDGGGRYLIHLPTGQGTTQPSR
jgi:hypothetical protein